MKVVLTVEDSVICKPDTIVIRFNYFDKKTTIAELKKCFREFVYKLDELITASKDLDVNKLELGRLNFNKSSKTVTVAKGSLLMGSVEKTNETRFDGYTLSCDISYTDSIENKAVSELYLKLLRHLNYIVSLDFKCEDLEKYKDELLRKIVDKGYHKAEIIAEASGLKQIKPVHVDGAVSVVQVNYSSFYSADCDYEACCDDDYIEDFISNTEKKGSVISDKLTITYEIE